MTPGGGGWGDPLDRDPEHVSEDYRLGLVSRDSALEDYGVILNDQGDVDISVTEAERRSRRAKRHLVTFFDRGQRFRERLAEGRISLTIDDSSSTSWKPLNVTTR